MSNPVPAIVERAVSIDLLAERIVVAVADIRSTETQIIRLEGRLEDARGAAQMKRIDVGRMLIQAREEWPERGPNAKGWGEFLDRVKLEQSTAWRYMALAGYVAENGLHAGEHENTRAPTYGEAGVTSSEVAVDRDTWCTPRWITEAIGGFDLDPCSNERSHVNARKTYRLDRGDDGLDPNSSRLFGSSAVFINPPYSDVTPWIRAYAHTRFCFLLKLDPSTKWFAELYKHTQLILIPRGTRVEFEAPPGVPADKQNANPFPHALFYARAEDATQEIRTLCFAWRIDHEPTT